jgi:SAM-dependent methyltransferase
MPTSPHARRFLLPLAALPLLLLFALTLFLSAALLFLVELMIGKTLLPMLGGTPAVWNTCMVFYQALLLAGYGYAHVSTAWLGVRRQSLLHLGVLLLPFLTLSLTVDRSLFGYGEGSPIPGLLLGLLLSVGLPFFVLSTTAPLLQKWFADTDHPAAKDPYFLYAASNLGSMVGLNSYPLVIEELLEWGLPNQRLLWQIGYVVLVVLTALCALCLWQSGVRSQESGVRKNRGDASLTPDPCPLTPGRRLRWVALAFVPSSLMLGATTYITTDIAAIPLLWVLPLDLYLLSFILVFSRLPAGVHRWMVAMLPYLVLVLLFLMLSEFSLRIWWKILVHLAVLFVASMVCHGELARDRPPTRYLTGFYLWMSFGGVLGGLFNALVAPVIFNGIAEYPLVLVLACLLTPALEEEKSARSDLVWSTGLMGFYLGIGVALLVSVLGRSDLTLRGLAGIDGFWLWAALLAAAVLVSLHVRGARDDRAVRWLDLGLPAALGILAAGLTLSLGWRITGEPRGLDWVFSQLHDASSASLPGRFTKYLDPDSDIPRALFMFVLPVVLCALFINRPLRFGLGVGALLLAHSFCNLLDGDVIARQRSFFGALHVTNDGNFRRLLHGTTLHGMQRLRWNPSMLAACTTGPLAAPDVLGGLTLLAAGQDTWLHPGREPLTYFHRTGPIGQVFTAYESRWANRPVAVIGLGTGTLATYGQKGQPFTFYEIDPLIKRIAFDRGGYFTFVPDAQDRGVGVDLVLGDARLQLEDRARNGVADKDKFALLVVDAFSSDAIPMHLLTREALAIYLDNLADDGLLVFHISNRYLDLEPVLGNLAAAMGLAGFIQTDWDCDLPGKTDSNWVVLARQESMLDRLVHEGRWEQWQSAHGWEAGQEAMALLTAFPDASGRLQAQGAVCFALFERLRAPWRRLKVRPEVGAWTDDYTNLLRVFDWKN